MQSIADPLRRSFSINTKPAARAHGNLSSGLAHAA